MCANLKYLTVLEAAKYIGKSDKTIRKYITTGKLKGIVWDDGPYGKRQMIPIPALDALKDEHTPTHLEGLEPLEVENPETTELITVEGRKFLLESMEAIMDKRLEGMEERISGRLEGLETRLEERDQRLVEVMRRLMEEKQEEEARKKKPGLVARVVKRLFG
jgi:hypothetical protein